MTVQFKREHNYSIAIDKVRGLCNQYGENVFPVPNENSIICYYQGKPFVQINDTSWTPFSNSYVKHFKSQKTGESIRDKSNKDKLESNYTTHKDEILYAIGKGLSRDKERCSEQYIAQHAMCDFKNDGYVICGMETCIPNISGEIDMVAINPKKKKILLIEYKCQYGALITSKANIKKHYEDYNNILELIKNEDKSNNFITGILNAYEVMCKLYNAPCCRNKLKADDFSVEIVFLITNCPYHEKNNRKGNLGKSSYKRAQELLKDVPGANNAYYITFDKPEDIDKIPDDIISDRYKGIDKLIFPEKKK